MKSLLILWTLFHLLAAYDESITRSNATIGINNPASFILDKQKVIEYARKYALIVSTYKV